MTTYAEVAIECDALSHAETLFDLLEPCAEQLSHADAAALGPVSHYLGGRARVLGRYDQSSAFLAQAASFSYQVDAKFFAARTELQWGQMLVAKGDDEKARQHLTAAPKSAGSLGCGTVKKHAAAALNRLV